MSTRGISRTGRGGRGGCSGKLHGRGNNYSLLLNNKYKGLYTALGNHVFDYSHKGYANQMRNM